MRAWKVHWLREDRMFVVVGGSGIEILRTEDIENAWEVAEAIQSVRDRRNRDRRAEIEDVAAVRARLRPVAA